MGAGAPDDLPVDRVSPGTVVLHVTAGGTDARVCRALLQSDGERPDLLRIVYGGDPSGEPVVTPRINRGRIVAVGDARTADWDNQFEVRTVESPSDLPGVGIRVGEVIEELSGTDRPLVACFTGLEAVFEATSFETAFEFVHLLTGQLAAAEASAHFHLDGSGYDEGTLARLSALFDVVVCEGSDGSLSVTSR